MTDLEHSDTATVERLAALAELDILDTPAERNFDDIVLLATQVCAAPVALISLVADKRQWFKARQGFAACETTLDKSVCRFTMVEDGLLVIPDLRADSRTKHNVLVSDDPFIRFYAGAPLRDRRGIPIGSLCVIDDKPRPDGLNPDQAAGLLALGRQVMAHLEARRLYNLQGDTKDAAHAQTTFALATAEQASTDQAAAKDAAHAETTSELADARRVGQLREHFVAVLGHDLRNPLSGIVGGLQVLERSTSPAMTAKVIAMMKQSAGRMAELIDNTLDFARTKLGAGVRLDRNSDAPLGPTLKQIIDELQSAYPERVIEAKIDLTDPVDCDRARIGQLFSNLLSNALTHGDASQSICVLVSIINNNLVLSVSNGGQPIPQEKLRLLFQPYSEDRGRIQDVGLGLYISAEIARAHGGSLTVSSNEKETVFSFTMPLKLDPQT